MLSVHLGGGDVSTPILPCEMLQHVQSEGWPSRSEVYDTDGDESTCRPCQDIDFYASSKYRPWPTSRSPLNVDRDGLDFKAMFHCVEKGFLNLINSIGKEAATSGERMYMCIGRCRPLPEDALQVIVRTCFVLSGVVYLPQ